MATTVRDVMMPEPWTIDASTSIEDAAHSMRAWDVRSILVVDEGELVGVLTDTDVVVWAIASMRAPSTVPVRECCDHSAQRLQVDQSIDEALGCMRVHHLERMPVIEEGQLVGTVWLSDLALMEASPEPPRHLH